MSIDGIQNSYLNYGFDLNVEGGDPMTSSTSDGRGNTVQKEDGCDAITKQTNDACNASKATAETVKVHFFRRNPNLSEQTSLLQQEGEVSVAYFVRPEKKNKLFNRFKLQHACLAFSDCLHKVVYFCLVADFVLLAKRYLQCDAPNSIITSFAVISCCLLTAAAFMVGMDLCINKLPVICVGFVVYVTGITALSWLTANVSTSSSCRWWSIVALFLACFGEATTRTVLPEFAMMHPNSKDAEAQKLFVWKLHWVSNLIIVVSIAVITAIDQNFNFETGFYISIGFVTSSFILFLVPFKHYRVEQAHIGTLRIVHNILTEAKEVKKRLVNVKRSSTFAEEGTGTHIEQPITWLDYAMSKHGGTYEEAEVNEVKCLYDVTILFLCLIPYWVVHAQCYTTYYYQGMHLDTRIADTNFPIAWLSLLSVSTVMLLAPFLDRIVYPALAKRDLHFPVAWRMMLGMILGCVSVIIAGYIESAGISHTSSKDVVKQWIGKLEITAAGISIFAQVPQYICLAFSEALTGLTALNVAHQLCSGGFRRLATGIYFVTMALGHLLTLVIISLGWYPSNHYFLDTTVRDYFFVLAGLTGINVLVLAAVIYRMVDIPSRLQNS